jgi:hypothetical protein
MATKRPTGDAWPVLKRLLAGPLWFLATLTVYSLVAAFLGAPHEVGPIVAFVIATLVVLDPGGLIWPPVERPVARTARTPAVLRSSVNSTD